jgi:hypothetical protein
MGPATYDVTTKFNELKPEHLQYFGSTSDRPDFKIDGEVQT